MNNSTQKKYSNLPESPARVLGFGSNMQSGSPARLPSKKVVKIDTTKTIPGSSSSKKISGIIGQEEILKSIGTEFREVPVSDLSINQL